MAGQATATIRNKQWDVSVAVTPWELVQGLGGLPGIPAQSGMLFDLGVEQTIQVTTVPMLFPIDIAFLSEKLVVTEVYRNVQPGYLVTSTGPGRFFFEVNAGELEGIAEGDQAVAEVIVPAQAVAPDWVSVLLGFMGFVVMGVFMVSFVRDLVKGMFEEPEKRLELSPHTTRSRSKKDRGRYIIKMDRMGNIIITHTERPGDIFLQFESDKELVYDILKKSEREDLDKGWAVEIHDTEPRVSILDALWEVATSPETRQKYLGQTMRQPKVMEYRVEKNEPYDTWAVVELWPAGTVRNPFKTEAEAVKREETIGEYYGWKLKRVPDLTAEERRLLDPKRFPKRTKALYQQLKGFNVIHVHDDGDLTVRSRGKLYVVTTEGEVFQQRTGDEALRVILGEAKEQDLSVTPVGTCYQDAWRFLIKEGEGYLVHGTVFSQGKRIKHAWVETETGYIWEPQTGKYYTTRGFNDLAAPQVEQRYTAEKAAIMAARTKSFGPWTYEERTHFLTKKMPPEMPAVVPTKPSRARKENELEYLADSPEFLTLTIEDIGYRDKIDNAFQEAIARAKGYGNGGSA